jgi:hypothetical protein
MSILNIQCSQSDNNKQASLFDPLWCSLLYYHSIEDTDIQANLICLCFGLLVIWLWQVCCRFHIFSVIVLPSWCFPGWTLIKHSKWSILSTSIASCKSLYFLETLQSNYYCLLKSLYCHDSNDISNNFHDEMMRLLAMNDETNNYK